MFIGHSVFQELDSNADSEVDLMELMVLSGIGIDQVYIICCVSDP